MTTATEPRQWSMPDARALLRFDAPRPDWLAARMHGVGGSEIGVLLGHSTWQTRFGLWQLKTGQERDTRASAMMERGADLEPLILRKFTAETGLATRRQGLVQSRRNPRMLFSPDALAEDGAIVEGKLVSQWARDSWTDPVTHEKRPPALYEWQVRQGLAVTGKTVGYIAALDADSWQLDVFDVYAAATDYPFLSDVVSAFWDCVETGVAPPIDYGSVSPEEMLARYREVIHPDEIAEALIPEQVIADVERLAVIRAAASTSRAMDKEEREIKSRLTMQIGDKEYLGIAGRPLVRWKAVKETKFREKDLKAEQPELAERYTDRGTTRRLEIVKGAAA